MTERFSTASHDIDPLEIDFFDLDVDIEAELGDYHDAASNAAFEAAFD